MKELSTEEKALRYDEAIKRAEEYYKEGKTLEYANDIVSDVFPELKESEDEGIRKALIKYYSFDKDGGSHALDNITPKQIVAWLEKQGEQKFSDIDNKFLRMRETKPANIVEFLDRLTTVEQEFLWEHIEKVKKIDREEREQKPIDKVEPIFNVGDKIQYLKGCGTIMTIEKIENDEYIFANNLGHTTIEDGNKWYLVERNPTWSEEDDYYHGIIQYILNNECVGEIDKENAIKWFKSIKDKIQPQPKLEWSKDDEDILNTIINHFEIDLDCTENDDIIRWLKSLNPQPKQEWSENDEVKDNWEYIQDFIKKLGHFPKDSDELDVLINYVLSKKQKFAWNKEDEKIINDLLWIIEAYRKNGFNETHKYIADKSENWLKSLKYRYNKL